MLKSGAIYNRRARGGSRFLLAALASGLSLLFQLTAQSGDVSFRLNEGLPQARVFVVQDPRSIVAFEPKPEHIGLMIQRGIEALTGKANPREAWLSLVSTQDVVGIKVFTAPGGLAGTRVQVVAGIVESLLAAGLRAGQIIVWDRRLFDLRAAGYAQLAEQYKIELAGAIESGFDEKVFYETPLLGRLVWGDHEFEKSGEGIGRKSFVSTLVTQRLTKIIAVSPLMNHNFAGVSGSLFSVALGSIDNVLRFESNPGRLALAIPEIYALPELSDKSVLNITDALICQYEGEERTLLHYSKVLGQIRFSKDPVALDTLSVDELERQRTAANIASPKVNRQIYENAAVMDLGIADLRRIQSVTLSPSEHAAQAAPPVAPNTAASQK